MDIFDIYIAYASWGNGGKKRPVLILEQSSRDIIAFSITTQYQNKSELIRSKYFEISEWRQVGLDKQSYIDTNNTVTLPFSSVDVNHPVGTLTEADVIKFVEFLSK
ncbi:MAG: hypothetical protein FWD71_19415 [Oscillospiraceae bacterium]|nr:hypothetical protein [Oscillospiraceae bacterium]